MRTIRRVNVEATISGGKYYGVLLIVVELGVLYNLALVSRLHLITGPAGWSSLSMMNVDHHDRSLCAGQ